jgi:hypothetical protein
VVKKEEGTKKKKGEVNPTHEKNDTNLDLSNMHILLTTFLSYIDTNSNKNIEKLSEVMRKK